jgi:hypothetical protein
MVRPAPALLGLAILVGFAMPPPLAAADPLPERAPRIANYDIRVTLDAGKKTLTGSQRLTWTNPSADAVPDLWFHLYLNAFRNTKSTFWRESGGQLRGDEMPEDGWGWIEVTSLRLADGTDLTRALTFESPDDGNRDDRTAARVVLPRAVGPGETIALDIAFTATLPRIFARTGYTRDYFLVGQWFPKIAVYEPAGRRGRTTGGWNAHQFHAHSEFYADFGAYRVEMTVPAGYVHGATGVRVASRDNGNGTVTYVHEQDNVIDFAWTVHPRFVELKRRFVAAREVSEDEARRIATLLDRPIEQVRLTDVEVTLLLQPEHLPQAERHFRAAFLGLKYFGLWYGRYPHRTLTVVDPAPGAGGSAGMEYPTFITAGTTALFNYWPFQELRAPEMVTVHEFGHQFWQGQVASNEFEEAWLDEGINSYSTGKVMEVGYGSTATMARFLGQEVGEVDLNRLQNGPNRIFDAIRQASWRYADSGQYSFNSYARPALVLRTLEAHLGAQTMARVMRTYQERWRYRHPSSDDFYAVVNDVAGRDLTPLLKQLFETGALLDYEIASVRSEPQVPAAGRIDGRTVAVADPPEHAPFETRVLVRRRGEVVLPVTIAFTFEGKAPERVTWSGAERWKTFTFTRPERLQSVQIDPDRGLVLDVDWLRNGYRVEPDRRAAVSLTVRWVFFVQQVLGWVGV